MQISILLQQLPTSVLHSVHLAQPEVDIFAVLVLQSDQQNFLPDCLYVGKASDLPALLPENINLLLQGRQPDAFSGCGRNIGTLSPSADLLKVLNTLQETLLYKRRVIQQVYQMTSSLLNYQGIQDLILQASDLLGNPIFLVDQEYRYVAWDGRLQENDNSIYAQRIREEQASGAINPEGVQYLQHAKLSPPAPSTRPQFCYNAFLDRTMLVCPILVGNVKAATLSLIEYRRPLRDVDQDCLEALGTIISQEMKKNINYFQTTDYTAYTLLGELLDNPVPDIKSILRRLKRAGIQDFALFQIAVLYAPGQKLTNIDFEIIGNQLRSIVYPCIRMVYQHQYVLLFCGRRQDLPNRHILESLRKTAEEHRLVVGLSNPFRQLEQTKHFYQQALRAIRLGLHVPIMYSRQPLYRYQDYTLVEMLELCRERENLMDFCSPMLLKLLDYDRENQTDLMNTLYEYLDCSQNTQLAAERLFIHKNTLLYRLNKIRSIIDNDLTYSWDLLLLSLSFRILILLDVYRPNRAKLAWEKLEQEQTSLGES